MIYQQHFCYFCYFFDGVSKTKNGRERSTRLPPVRLFSHETAGHSSILAKSSSVRMGMFSSCAFFSLLPAASPATT